MEAAMRTDQETQEMCKLCGKHPRWENMQLCAECLGKGKAPDEEPSVTTMPRKQHSRICPDCGKNHAGGKVGRGRTDVCQSCLTTKKQETREAQKRGAPLPLRAKRACAQPSGDPLPKERLTPPPEELAEIIVLDIENYPEILDWLQRRAREEVRTMHQQATFELLRLARIELQCAKVAAQIEAIGFAGSDAE
jgi:hypothetical protein